MTIINDATAIEAAQGLYRSACLRMKKEPHETIGEIAFAEGRKLAVLFDSNRKLAAVYRVGEERVSDLDGAELVAAAGETDAPQGALMAHGGTSLPRRPPGDG
jgi:hypothetical protein